MESIYGVSVAVSAGVGIWGGLPWIAGKVSMAILPALPPTELVFCTFIGLTGFFINWLKFLSWLFTSLSTVVFENSAKSLRVRKLLGSDPPLLNAELCLKNWRKLLVFAGLESIELTVSAGTSTIFGMGFFTGHLLPPPTFG